MGTASIVNSQRGQALIEMALSALMFLFLFFGVLEFSRALYTYNTIVQATRAAARWAVVNVGGNNDTGDIAKTKNLLVRGNPDTSTGPSILYGLSDGLVHVSVVTIESDTTKDPPIPISQKISVKVQGFQFRPVLPITGSITLPPFETSLYTESMGIVPS